MNTRLAFAAVAVAAIGAGALLWYLNRPPAREPLAAAPAIAPAALYAAAFADLGGQRQSLGQFQGRVLVINFWATWCAPCREEMPAFDRVAARWHDRGVRFVGLSAEEREKVARFAAALKVGYPLWVGGDAVGELSRRLGNRLGVLPHTAIVGPDGRVLDIRVGPYTETELEQRLTEFATK